MGAISNIEKLNNLPVTLAGLGGVTEAQVEAKILEILAANPSSGSASSNRIINGGMQVVQRGSSFSQTGNNKLFTADRWYFTKRGMPTSNVDGVSILNHQNTTQSEFYRSPRFLRTQLFNSYAAQTSGDNSIILGTKLEYNSISDLRGKPFTLKFKMRADRVGSFPVIFRYGARNYMTAVLYNGGYQEITVQVPGGIIPQDIISDLKVEFVLFSGNTARGPEIGNLDTWVISTIDGFSTAQNLVQGFGDSFDISDVTLQAGLSADFQLRNLQEETLLCQKFYNVVRFFHKWTNQTAGQTVISSVVTGVRSAGGPILTVFEGSNHSNLSFPNTLLVGDDTITLSATVISAGSCTMDATYALDAEDYT